MFENFTKINEICKIFENFVKINEILNAPKELYIDLVKKCVSNTIYEDSDLHEPYNKKKREDGADWPSLAHTMIGMKRLDNIHYCLKEILKNNIPGDCIETGVWRGGAVILMRAILKAYDVKDRKVWVADSFEGLPKPNLEKYPQDYNMNLHLYSTFLAVSLEQVKENFKKYNLLDEQVIFLKGFFSETLRNASIEKIALLRLDGDMYESTIQALEALYPKLSIGGYIIIDDFSIRECFEAVKDYRSNHNIIDTIIEIDSHGVFWQKMYNSSLKI